MSASSVPSSPDTPRELLAGLRDLTQKVRAAQRGAWFPLLLLGLLLLGGILVDRLTYHAQTGLCPQTAGGCVLVKQGSPLYWTAGLVLVYAATAVFYLRRSRERGVGSPVRPYVVAGLVIVALIAPARFWNAGQTVEPGNLVNVWGLHLHAGNGTTEFLTRLTGRAVSIGLPLLVLSWVERSRALLLFALVYLAVELIPVTAGTANAGPASPWNAAPRLAVPAVVLLLGSLGFGLTQRQRSRPRSGAGAGADAGTATASGGPA